METCPFFTYKLKINQIERKLKEAKFSINTKILKFILTKKKYILQKNIYLDIINTIKKFLSFLIMFYV
jgi:hypothetical protein